MANFFERSMEYVMTMSGLEAAGLVLGLLAVYYLIRESIFTWPAGIGYIFVSFVIFWQEQLYGDFVLHIFFLILHIYGWYFWVFGPETEEEKVAVTWLSTRMNMVCTGISLVGIFLLGYFLSKLHVLFHNLLPASLPYWDAATTSLSLVAVWLMARKKIENWVYWFIVDILAAGIYTYKQLYFYAILYFIYIGMAITGFLAWKKQAKALAR